VNLFHWTAAAKADLRGVDREQALNILHRLTDYGAIGCESAIIASVSNGWKMEPYVSFR
jgi:hypothetical protein